MATRYLSEGLVLEIHRNLIQIFGGSHGLRDRGLLLSALSQPKMTVGGKFIHRTVFDKAAAYGYHLCANHPFVDGNKRVAFMAMYQFLEKNGYEFDASERDMFETMMAVATGKLKKLAIAEWLRTHSKRLPR
jgi:death-on-curing protein